ncbi:MAG: T9SS type A sorting domain-containing protein [Bacteroidetes bacterium]|nr:MAG: T9SS type A sorting domain-containing protein [Bacteroidota bacterium]
MRSILPFIALVTLLLTGSAVYAQTDEASGTLDQQEQEAIRIVSVYPNPATERLLIEFTTDKMGEEVPLRVRDADNKVILKRNLFTVAGGNMVILPVEALPTGVYIVQLDEGRKAARMRWTKM